MRSYCSHADRVRLDVVSPAGEVVGDVCEQCSIFVVLPERHQLQSRLFERGEGSGPLPGKGPVTVVVEPNKTKFVMPQVANPNVFVPPVDPRAAADPSTPVHYVVGFMFNRDYSKVVLVTKEKPAWQKGRLNGPGGKIEAGESPVKAMIREFHEETGEVAEGAWRRFCVGTVYNGAGLTAVVHYFRAVEAQWKLDGCHTTTAEEIGVYDLSELIGYTRSCPRRLMCNLHWLLPMAMTMEANTADYFEVIERTEV